MKQPVQRRVDDPFAASAPDARIVSVLGKARQLDVARTPLGFEDTLEVLTEAAAQAYRQALLAVGTYQTQKKRVERYQAELKRRAQQPASVFPSPWPEVTKVQALLVTPIAVLSSEMLCWEYRTIVRDSTDRYAEHLSAFAWHAERAAVRAATAALLALLEQEDESFLQPAGVRRVFSKTELLVQPTGEAPPRLVARWRHTTSTEGGSSARWPMSLYVPASVSEGQGVVPWLRELRNRQQQVAELALRKPD
jgi:hypothetical protein